MRCVRIGSVVAATFAATLTLTTQSLAQPNAAVEPPAIADHELVVERIGIGFAGVSEVPFPNGAIAAPVISARYWMSSEMGLEIGLGLATAGGSVETDNGAASDTVDKNGAFAVMVHGGLPLALHNAEHYSFQIIPELNFGMAQQEISVDGGDNIENSGRRIDAGVRAGAEIHFGFIGAPELTLTGSVGLFYTNQQTKTEQGNASRIDTTTGLATTSFNNPWDFFTSHVAARYYF
ncbi:MAG: hypothetical protein ACOC1F_04110 [Myxococcota bacterium]